MSQPFRLRDGGRIERGAEIPFTFDGVGYTGYSGDTLASALLANGVRLVGRSFKYHRPRGLFTAGPEEPNALVELRSGVTQEPNTRATTVELYDGLEAASQNRWPSLNFDLFAVNQLFARFFAAGFYYKTFMWPAAFWERVYEPLIRRAAGLGRAARGVDPDHYEQAHAHCDVLVIGSGAAGLAAARAAGESGARVILAEQDFEFGGGLLIEPKLEGWRRDTLAALEALPEVRLMTRTTVFGLYDHNVAGAVERVADHLSSPLANDVRQRSWVIRAKEIVFAAGAGERLIAFPDNDRPGVMLATAALAYVRRYAVLPGRRAILFTNNDAAYETAFALHDAGVQIAAIVDVRKTSARYAEARAIGLDVWLDASICGVAGAKAVEGVLIRRHDSAASAQKVAADLVCISGGYNPSIQLAAMTGAKPRWREDLAAFVPDRLPRGQRAAGAAQGTFGIAAAADEGHAAGLAAAQATGHSASSSEPLRPECLAAGAGSVTPFWEVDGAGKAFVDLQNDVTTDDIRLAHREGYSHVEHAKRYTTHGMATDQGKTGGLVGVAVLAEARGQSIAEVGCPTFRPYVTPVTWGAFAGREVGKHFQPVRRTALHDWHERHGAVFLETGLWLRPLYYTRTNETGWEPILREARAVRTAAGICDVSTLGKIDIQGADAGTFLDRLYVNTFSTLPVAKARYGLMLREDGIVFDDGTTSRLGEHHYLMTTTTAKAADVLAHMEFYAQTVWPELDVSFCSVTDHWAQMSIAGPNARGVLERLGVGFDIGNEAFPFMACREGTAAGCPVRVFRVSFSGELAYEIATPAGYAEHVWDSILDAGRRDGLVPYGLEALGLLRIEKGHVAGPELNGHTTAADLGMARMMKKTGDVIGRVNAMRPGLVDPDRPRLVGIRALTSGWEPRLRGGAHIVPSFGATESLGWVTSVTRSVELDRWIGLAMVRHGPERIGERLVATFPLANEECEVEITSPHHVDPENVRVRA